MRKVLLVIGILVATLLPATAASARGQTWLAPVQEGRGQTWASIIDPATPCSPWRPCNGGNLVQPHIICWHVNGANSPCWTGSSFAWIPWVW